MELNDFSANIRSCEQKMLTHTFARVALVELHPSLLLRKRTSLCVHCHGRPRPGIEAAYELPLAEVDGGSTGSGAI